MESKQLVWGEEFSFYHTRMTKKWMLWYIYHAPFGKPLLLLFRTRIFSACMGWLFRTSLSRYLIRPLRHFYSIQLDTYQIPEKGFRTLNDFFIRPTQRGFRVFPSWSSLWSPVDGCLEIFQNINLSDNFCIKGYNSNLQKLFWPQVSDFIGGDVCFFRLRFSDYHRFHFFDDGEIISFQSREWPLYSVDNSVLDTWFWVNNKSHCMKVRTKNFWEVLILEIGATNVGCIKNHKNTGDAFVRSEEKWYFELGGSAVLTVFKKNTIRWRTDILDASSKKEETCVLTGDILNLY